MVCRPSTRDRGRDTAGWLLTSLAGIQGNYTGYFTWLQLVYTDGCSLKCVWYSLVGVCSMGVGHQRL